MLPQLRSGGDGGMQTVGLAGEQLLRAGAVVGAGGGVRVTAGAGVGVEVATIVGPVGADCASARGPSEPQPLAKTTLASATRESTVPLRFIVGGF